MIERGDLDTWTALVVHRQQLGKPYTLAESQKPPGLLSIGADEGVRIHILRGRACKPHVKLI